jgi:hypothetical protein
LERRDETPDRTCSVLGASGGGAFSGGGLFSGTAAGLRSGWGWTAEAFSGVAAGAASGTAAAGGISGVPFAVAQEKETAAVRTPASRATMNNANML